MFCALLTSTYAQFHSYKHLLCLYCTCIIRRNIASKKKLCSCNMHRLCVSRERSVNNAEKLDPCRHTKCVCTLVMILVCEKGDKMKLSKSIPKQTHTHRQTLAPHWSRSCVQLHGVCVWIRRIQLLLQIKKMALHFKCYPLTLDVNHRCQRRVCLFVWIRCNKTSVCDSVMFRNESVWIV